MPHAIRRILIVEDDPIMQAEAVKAVSVFGDAETHCVCTKGEAERLVGRQVFNLAIVDLGLPDGSGISLIRHLAEKWPETILVARTVFDDDERLFGALAAGAQGYLLKGQTQESLHEQLLAAANGELVISPRIARKMLAYFRGNAAFLVQDTSVVKQNAPLHPLTPREADVLALVGKGLTIAETASQLQLSENTVKTHVKAAYSKLNIRSRASAALEAQRLGLL